VDSVDDSPPGVNVGRRARVKVQSRLTMILADIADEALAYPPGSLLVAELAALKEAQAETSRRREPARRGRGLAKYLYPTVRRRTD